MAVSKKQLLAWLLLICSMCFFFSAVSVSAETLSTASTGDPGTIHFLTLDANGDAILLECNGKFGMVDSGEDSDYPDGSDSRYPYLTVPASLLLPVRKIRSFPICAPAV